MVSRTSKLLLINAVRHSESHNKRNEESDMWHTRRRQLEEEAHDKCRRVRHRKDDLHYSFRPGGFLDPDNAPMNDVKLRPTEPKTSNKYTKQLMQYEEELGPERWGHGGYKELYPEEFQDKDNASQSDRSTTSSERAHKRSKKKQKRRKAAKDLFDQHPPADKYHRLSAHEPPVYVVNDSDSDDYEHSSKREKKSKKRKRSDSCDDDKPKKHKKHKNHKKHKHKAKKHKE